MKIYLLTDPKQYSNYARFSHTGTWTDGQLCKDCNQPTSKLVEPLIIEWEPDSDYVGDFSWRSYTTLITEDVKIFLNKENYSVDYGEVKVAGSAKSKKGQKVVKHPYIGPHLFWLKPRDEISIDLIESNVTLITSCNICNQTKYKFRNTNLVIDRTSWKKEKIFRISQFQRSAATFVTEEALAELLDSNFTNFGYSEAGVIK